MTELPELASPRIKALLESGVRSLDDLVILVHVHAAQGRCHTVDSIASATQLDGDTALKAIEGLVASGLLRTSRPDEPPGYAYAPSSDETRLAVDDLVRLYTHSRFAVISSIAADAVERIRENARLTFARVLGARRGHPW
jgi:hypothetical protein